MAKAIVASAVANQMLLAEGAIVPRRLLIGDVECAIENGCGGDMIHAGMVVPVKPCNVPLEEKLRLTATGLSAVIALLGRSLLMDHGVLEPDR